MSSFFIWLTELAESADLSKILVYLQDSFQFLVGAGSLMFKTLFINSILQTLTELSDKFPALADLVTVFSSNSFVKYWMDLPPWYYGVGLGALVGAVLFIYGTIKKFLPWISN